MEKYYFNYSLDTNNSIAFKKAVQQIQIKPTQIIRPGDLHPRTGLPFRDPYTGGPLKTYSWIKSEEYQYKSIINSKFYEKLSFFLDEILIYQSSIVDCVQSDGKGFLDISYFIQSDFSQKIIRPRILSDIWKKLADLKSEFGFSYYQEFENTDDDDDDELEIAEKFSLEIHSRPLIPLSENEKATMNQALFHLDISQTGDQIYILNTSDWFEKGRDESINNHIEACENFLDTQFEQLYPIISQNHNQMILRRNTTYFSLGTLFSAKMISYLARLNMNLLFIDTSLEKPKDRYLSKG